MVTVGSNVESREGATVGKVAVSQVVVVAARVAAASVAAVGLMESERWAGTRG